MATRKVWFATNRSYKERQGKVRFGDRFHASGPQFYRAGSAKTREKQDGEFKVESYTVAPENAADGDPKKQKLGSKKVFQELRTALENDKSAELLIFLHGYSNDFEGPIARAAELAEKYGFKDQVDRLKLLPFAFCWPSDASLVPWRSYYADRADAKASGPAMARALSRLIDFIKETQDARCDRSIHLVAHSMGNWALRHFVQSTKELTEKDRPPRIFDQVFLMAADEDYDALEKPEKLGPLADMARAVHVYYSEGDDALDISDITKGNMERLGSVGPKTMDGLSSKIRAIDCAAVDETPRLDGDHQYYRLRDEVIDDVRAVLRGEVPDEICGRAILQPGRRYRLKSKDSRVGSFGGGCGNAPRPPPTGSLSELASGLQRL